MAEEINREQPINAAEKPAAKRPPAGPRWLATKAAWALESILWRLADSFHRIGDGFRGRGALGNSLVALMAALVLGAGGATAVYLTSSGSSDEPAPVTAQVPSLPERESTAITDSVANDPPQQELHGVVPEFGTGGGGSPSSAGDGSSSGGAEQGAGASQSRTADEPADSVAPEPAPSSPPLAVAHRFATAFVSYEIGEESPRVEQTLEQTATTQLARALTRKPPRLPANSPVPKAEVVNVVKGPGSDKKSMDVSVALKRLGMTSELRLGLEKNGKRWLVERIKG